MAEAGLGLAGEEGGEEGGDEEDRRGWEDDALAEVGAEGEEDFCGGEAGAEEEFEGAEAAVFGKAVDGLGDHPGFDEAMKEEGDGGEGEGVEGRRGLQGGEAGDAEEGGGGEGGPEEAGMKVAAGGEPGVGGVAGKGEGRG